MLHKTKSHCSPYFISADVLNNSSMPTTSYNNNKISHFEKLRVKDQLQNLENITVLNILV
jgi:hypothetical protein